MIYHIRKKDYECAVLIPIYKQVISIEEKISLQQISKNLNNYHIYFVAPEGLKIEKYKLLVPDAMVRFFPNEYFDGFEGYNHLMTSRELYLSFICYKKVLVCQTDVFIFSNNLEQFLTLPYDYIGAPFAKHKPWECRLCVGNGGLSLRNVQSVLRIIEKELGKEGKLRGKNEDTFFSDCGEKKEDDFHVAPLDIALKFAFDQSLASISYELNDHRIPFGFHGWYNYDTTISKYFIAPYLKKTYFWKKNIPNNEYIFQIKEFFTKNKLVYMYGAGDIGQVFYEFCQMENIDFEGYLVSDDQTVEKLTYNGKNLNHISDIDNIMDCAVAITILRRYRESNDFEKFLQLKGVTRILTITTAMVFAVEEELLGGKYLRNHNLSEI